MTVQYLLKAGLLMGLAISVLSCKYKVEGEIEVKVTPSNVIVINTARLSCSQIAEGDLTSPGVGAPSFQLGSLSLTWKGKSKNATILYIKIRMQSGFAGGEQVLTIGGDDLNALLCGVAPGSPCASTQIPAGDSTPRNAACAPRMGLSFVDNDAPAYGSGIVEVYGVETDPDDEDGSEDRPIRGETNFTFEYN